MTINNANKVLRESLYSDRWYFEQRGYKVWFIEKLNRQYNRVFPVTAPDGDMMNEICDFHLHLALKFVRKQRKPENMDRVDFTPKKISGLYEDDREGNTQRGDTDDGSELEDVVRHA